MVEHSQREIAIHLPNCTTKQFTRPRELLPISRQSSARLVTSSLDTMKEIDKISKQINQIAAPVREISKTVSKIIQPAIERLTEIMTPVVKNMNEMAKSFEPFLSQIHTISRPLYKRAEEWQAKRKQDVGLMAEKGWYPNWFTFFYTPSTEPLTLDELMAMHLKNNWDEITSKILEFCPNRSHILENAFNLHKSGNYIAAMPLFLSQADGNLL